MDSAKETDKVTVKEERMVSDTEEGKETKPGT